MCNIPVSSCDTNMGTPLKLCDAPGESCHMGTVDTGPGTVSLRVTPPIDAKSC